MKKTMQITKTEFPHVAYIRRPRSNLAPALFIIIVLIGMAARVRGEDGSFPRENAFTRLMRETLQAKLPELPVATVNVGATNATFQVLHLEKTLMVIDGNDRYAFRFKTPATEGDLAWSFRYEKSMGQFSWYILAGTGQMNGFTDMDRRILSRDVPGLGKAGDIFAVQCLPRKHLKTNAEYIIWFDAVSTSGILVSVNIVKSCGDVDYGFMIPK